MKPAIVSAVVIAFLSSFENYNTTTFAILADKTLVTVLAGQVRQGTTPALSALAVIIIGISLLGAILYEIVKRREQKRAEQAQKRALVAERSEGATSALPAPSSA
jgi:spermidine/putrescine transport system permease protein